MPTETRMLLLAAEAGEAALVPTSWLSEDRLVGDGDRVTVTSTGGLKEMGRETV